MARMARLVVPGQPHHVVQRGNRGMNVFFNDDDFAYYKELVAEQAKAVGTEIWAYCLMNNHVHFLMNPHYKDGLRAVFAEAHRRYSRHINFREGWRGHLWQGRFASFVLSDTHLAACARYIELNPVRADMTTRAADWPHSSARAHLERKGDTLLGNDRRWQRIYPDWAAYLDEDENEDDVETIRARLRTGRPWGNKDYIRFIEAKTGRSLQKQKPGPKPSDS